MSWNFYPFYYLLYHLTRSTIFFLRTCCNIFSTKYLFISRSSNTTTLSISIQKIFKRYEKCICICIMQIVLYPWERLRTLWDTNYFIFALVWVFAFFFFFNILCFCAMLFLLGQELNIFIGNQDTMWAAWFRQYEGFL